MATDQYHEPPEELSEEIRTRVRMLASLIEEAQAIGWYEERLSLERNEEARAIMQEARGEEFKHFGMDLEFLLRTMPEWRTVLKRTLFTSGDIVSAGGEAEDAAENAS